MACPPLCISLASRRLDWPQTSLKLSDESSAHALFFICKRKRRNPLFISIMFITISLRLLQAGLVEGGLQHWIVVYLWSATITAHLWPLNQATFRAVDSETTVWSSTLI